MTFVRYESRHPLGYIVLDRPGHGNAVNPAMLAELDDALATAEQDTDAKVVILRAEGADFCVGADPEDDPFDPRMATRPSVDPSAETGGSNTPSAHSPSPENPPPSATYNPSSSVQPPPQYTVPGALRATQDSLRGVLDQERARNRRLEFWFNFQRPTVAVVQGRCHGFGFHLAMGSNLVFASEDATFADPSVVMGQLPQQPLVVWLAGPRVARDLFLTGRDYSAAEAERAGLINRVVARAELEATAERFARAIAHCPADGLTIAKESLSAMMEARGLGAAYRVGVDVSALARAVEGDRSAGEFDFRGRVREAGLAVALAERDRVRGTFNL